MPSPARGNSLSGHAIQSTVIAPSANSPPTFTFVTHTRPPSKSPGTQRLVRSHVMRRVGKSRRKGRPVKAPLLEFDLEVPDEPFWDEASLHPSQDYFLNQSTVERVGDAVDQESDDRPSTSNLEASDAQSNHRVRPRQKVIQYSQDASQVQDTEPSENEHRQNEETIARIERLWVGRSDPFARYPINMNSRAHELIDHIFDDRNTSFKPFRDAWFPVGLMDPAAFHQVLANSALNRSLLRNIDKAPESYEAISHHTYAINLVNKRLSDPSFATSDELIGAITAFICYYHIIGNIKSWRIHMNGITEIVRLRGGPDSPSFNAFVRLTLSVADIGGSCTQDIPPTFPLPRFVPPSPTYPTPIDLPLLIARTSLKWRTILPSNNHHIITIVDDLSRLTGFLKAESIRTNGEIYQEASFASTHINPLLHRLLSLVPSTTKATDTADVPAILQEATRLASILYMAEIRRNFGILPVSSTIQLSKLRSLLSQSLYPYSQPLSSSERNQLSLPDPWTHFPALHLWILAMGVIESQSGSVQGAWFCERFYETAVLLGAASGTRAREGMGVIEEVVEMVLRRFLWIDELHGMMFRRNWQVLV